MTTRRSTRLSRAKEASADNVELHETGKEVDKNVVDVSGTDQQRNYKNQKRKQSTSRDALSPAVRRSTKKTKDGRMIDDFCWNCHEPGYDRICSTCPRVYHNDCITKKNGFTVEDVCPECQLESVDGTKYPEGLTADMLNKVLVCLFRKILAKTTLKSLGAVTGSNKRFWKRNDKVTIKPELLKWPQKEHKVCNPIDLEKLIEAVKRGGSYSKTTEFLSDVTWIYHNCCEAFGAESDVTKAASKVVKAVRSELLDIESCYQCYYNYYNEHDYYDEDPFMIVCKKPHQLLWAKLKGYPFWPAKCLKVIDGMAHIQFFGTHDKTSIKADTCYLMSRKNPTSDKIERESYQRATREVSVYVQNYGKQYGPFRYANSKVKFFPMADWHWIKKKPQLLSSSMPDKNTVYEQRYPIINLYRDVHIEIQNEFSSEEAEGNGINDQTTEGSDIVISSVIEISNENTFEDMNETQSSQNSYQNESFSECQTISNNTDTSWSPYSSQLSYASYGEDGNATIKCPNLSVLLPRIESSDFQYPSIRNVNSSDSEIEQSTSQPVITSLQSCDEPAQSVRNPVSKLEHSSVKQSTRPSSNSQREMQYHPQPSTSQERMHIDSHSGNIDTTSGLPSSNNENAPSEFSSESYPSGSLQQEMANITSLIGINQDLSQIDPEVRKLALEAGHFIKQSGQAFLQYSGSFASGPKVVDALLRRLKKLDSAIADEERKKAEIKAKSNKAFNPILGQIINGTKKMAENKMEEDFNREKEELDKEMNNVQNVLSFHNEEYAKLISNFEKNHRNKETQTDLLFEAELKRFEEEMALEKLKFEQQMNDEVLEIKAKSWCVKCQNQATIHCCWNTNYCTEQCRISHLENHQPLCLKCKSHTVMIEEISSTHPETSEDNAINSNSSVAPVIEEC